MNRKENLVAIGRSRLLYDSIKYLSSCGYTFRAIITEKAYQEYDVTHEDFEKLARQLGACFFMSRKLNDDKITHLLREEHVKVAISVNWQYTVPESFLDLFACGLLNFHLGNLPDYKGNATLNWSILNGEKHIYGNIHKMAPELDAGDVVSRKAILILPDTYVGDILQQAAQMVPSLFEEALSRVLLNPQACELKGSTHGLRCYPRLPEDGQISWQQTAEEVHRLIRASGRPYPGAFSFLHGEKVTIWKAALIIPEERFLAVPGHVVAINKDAGSIRVACKEHLIEVQEIEQGGKVMPPTVLIKSIRERFKFKADV